MLCTHPTSVPPYTGSLIHSSICAGSHHSDSFLVSSNLQLTASFTMWVWYESISCELQRALNFIHENSNRICNKRSVMAKESSIGIKDGWNIKVMSSVSWLVKCSCTHQSSSTCDSLWVISIKVPFPMDGDGWIMISEWLLPSEYVVAKM